MMSKKFSSSIPIPYVFIFVFAILILALLYALFSNKYEAIWTGILTGAVVGAFFSLVQYVIDLDRHLITNRLQSLELKEVLTNRRQPDYYKELLRDSQYRVDVMGTSGSRLINDFLDQNTDSHVLLDAINANKSLKVRILIPTETHMSDKSKNLFSNVQEIVKELNKSHSSQFEIKRFDEAARHSFVIVDKDLVAGPIFQNVDSGNSPAIHISTRSDYGRKHLEYFEDIWAGAV